MLEGLRSVNNSLTDHLQGASEAQSGNLSVRSIAWKRSSLRRGFMRGSVFSSQRVLDTPRFRLCLAHRSSD